MLAEDLERDPVRYQGNWIPHRLRAATEDGIFFVGDSAGHCLPLTAEGIRTALYFGIACGRELRAVVSRATLRRRAGAGALRRLLGVARVEVRRDAARPAAGAARSAAAARRAGCAAMQSRRFLDWSFGHYLAIAPPEFVAAGPPPALRAPARRARSRLSGLRSLRVARPGVSAAAAALLAVALGAWNDARQRQLERGPGQRRAARTRRSAATGATSRSTRRPRTWCRATPRPTTTSSCATALPARPTLVTTGTGGATGLQQISANGRYVAFESYQNRTPDDTGEDSRHLRVGSRDGRDARAPASASAGARATRTRSCPASTWTSRSAAAAAMWRSPLPTTEPRSRRRQRARGHLRARPGWPAPPSRVPTESTGEPTDGLGSARTLERDHPPGDRASTAAMSGSHPPVRPCRRRRIAALK